MLTTWGPLVTGSDRMTAMFGPAGLDFRGDQIFRDRPQCALMFY